MNNQQNGRVILWLTWRKYESMYNLLTCTKEKPCIPKQPWLLSSSQQQHSRDTMPPTELLLQKRKCKEERSLKVNFSAILAHINQSKILNTDFLISIFDFRVRKSTDLFDSTVWSEPI